MNLITLSRPRVSASPGLSLVTGPNPGLSLDQGWPSLTSSRVGENPGFIAMVSLLSSPLYYLFEAKQKSFLVFLYLLLDCCESAYPQKN